MIRHLTVTGFVVDGGSTLLHWHPKLSIWLPPGGHIEADEDPVQAVLREVLEETGLQCEIVPHLPAFAFSNVTQLPSPFSIIVADAQDAAIGLHQHIDLSYVVRPVPGVAAIEPERDHGFIRVTAGELLRNDALPVVSCGVEMAVPEDVREVGLAAIALAATPP